MKKNCHFGELFVYNRCVRISSSGRDEYKTGIRSSIIMIFIFYLLLPLLLFWKAHGCKKNTWNEDVLSYDVSKAFLGFLSIIIIFHHISQRTCAPWLNPKYIQHGLDAFVFVGYFCVAVFFFFSGYGMYTASRKKPDFFRGFFRKRILPVLLPAVIMWLVFFAVEKAKGMTIESPVWINTYDYIWYIPAMLYLYLIFYLAFRVIKNDKAGVAVMVGGTVVYMVLCLLYSPGSWWYNTVHLFLIGVLVARHRDGFLRILKKHYVLWLILSLIVTIAGFTIANYYYQVISLFGGQYVDKTHFWVEIAGQIISACSFTFFVVLVGCKIRIGNPILKFLGSFTLETYLVHPLFVQLFGFAFIREGTAPLYYIESQFLYVIVILALSLPLAYGLHRLVSWICKKGNA